MHAHLSDNRYKPVLERVFLRPAKESDYVNDDDDDDSEGCWALGRMTLWMRTNFYDMGLALHSQNPTTIFTKC